MKRRRAMSKEEANARKGGYTATLDEALTIATGMDKEERKSFREKVDRLMKIRSTSKKGSKAWKDASNEIARLNGWPANY